MTTTISLDEGQAFDVANALWEAGESDMARVFSQCARTFDRAVIPNVSVAQRSTIQQAVEEQIRNHRRNDRHYSADELVTEVMPEL
jgi:hypothetical protein